ncbi:hypothetical protein [Hydrogenophaga sp. 5NK40-0174]|uniref:hypothetical protein n=1 Tax=Hydrogenophaga sp. 5NK40-0174 TaxID=3127649 RepID=UPI003107ECE8
MMIWRRATEKTLGGNYTWYDSAKVGVEKLPLIYCVGNAFPAREVDAIEHHLEGLFELGGAGGDPDWELYRQDSSEGAMFVASTLTAYSGLDPASGCYSEEEVKSCFARTMREYERAHPESREKIQRLIDKFCLEPDGAKSAEAGT